LDITVNTEPMNQRVRLHISPYEQMTLAGDSNAFPGAGNVGIGTTNPDSPLTVVGDVSATGTVSASTFQGDGSALTGIDPGNISSGDVNFNNITSTGTIDMDGTLTIQDKIKFDSNADYSTMNIYNESLETDISTIYFFGRDISGELDNVQVILKNSEQSGTIRLNSETGEIYSLSTNFNNSIDANDLGEDVVGDSELYPGVKSVKNFSVLCYGGNDPNAHCCGDVSGCPEGVNAGYNYFGCGTEGGTIMATGESGSLGWAQASYVMVFAQWPGSTDFVEVGRTVFDVDAVDDGVPADIGNITVPCIPNTEVLIVFSNINVESPQTRITYWYY